MFLFTFSPEKIPVKKRSTGVLSALSPVSNFSLAAEKVQPEVQSSMTSSLLVDITKSPGKLQAATVPILGQLQPELYKSG